MIRVGLLGGGFMGETHASIYKQMSGVKLTAVADRNQRKGIRLAARFGAKYFSTYEELLDANVCDVVDICLPTHMHEDSILAVVSRELHYLCEKPLTLSLEAANRIIAATREAGVKAMVAQVIRFWPEYKAIREALAGGNIGQPLAASATRLIAPPTWTDWIRDPTLSGGSLFDLHIHDLDFVYSLLGTPQSIYCSGIRGDGGGWDHVFTALNYDGAKANLEASSLMPPGYPLQMAFRLSGTSGCIDFRFSAEDQVDNRNRAKTELVLYQKGELPRHPENHYEDGYIAEIRYFMECIKQDCHPEIATLEEARDVIKIALAAKRSLETGTVVNL